MNPEEQSEIKLFFSTHKSAILDKGELRAGIRDVLDDLEVISNTFDLPLDFKN